jgi:hypothetical protein
VSDGIRCVFCFLGVVRAGDIGWGLGALVRCVAGVVVHGTGGFHTPEFLAVRRRVGVVRNHHDDDPGEVMATFYCTFGQLSQLRNCFVRVSAEDKRHVTELMYDNYGGEWCMPYTADEFEGQAEKFDLVEIPFGSHIPPVGSRQEEPHGQA